MKLIIDVDKQTFDKLTEYGEPLSAGNGFHDSILKAVANGKPLPKGHGRLLDENYVIAELVYRKNLLADNVKCGQVTEIFNNAVVIDADMESNNETNN